MNNTQWIYKTDSNNRNRYILGHFSENPLLCIGVNPSTATPNNPDQTIKSVERIAKINGFDGWIMINLYPQRATNPNDMDSSMDMAIHAENLAAIKEVVEKYSIKTIWAAWGTLIEKRTYLKKCLQDIYSITTSCTWVSIGKCTKHGHPHHPLYLSTKSPINLFNIEQYIKSLS